MIFAQPRLELTGARAAEPGRVGPSPRPAPTRSSSPPGRRAGWPASTSSMAPIGDRPLLAWTLAALAAAPEVERIVLVVARRTPSERVRAAPWLPAKVVAVVAGRRASPGVGRRRAGRARCVGAAARRDARAACPGGPRRSGRPRPRRRPTGRLAGPGRRGRPVPRRSTAPRSRSCRSSRRSSASTATGSRRPLDRSALARRPDTAGRPARACSREALTRLPGRTAPETWTDEAALLEACRIPVHAIPGEPTNLKVTHARRPRAGRARPPRPAVATRHRLRRRQPSVRARRAARPRRDLDRRRAPPPRSLRRRRRAPRGRRRAARRGRPRRPRADLPGRTRHPARDRQRELVRGCRRSARRRRVPPGPRST